MSRSHTARQHRLNQDWCERNQPFGDRILDTRLSGEIVAGLPALLEKQDRARRLFAPILARRDAIERARQEERWAREGDIA